jgi:trehalose 6-phosphate synthase
MKPNEARQRCTEIDTRFFDNRFLIIASNRGPVTFETTEEGVLSFTRGAGGLVSALTGLAQQMDITWVACAHTEADATWREGTLPLFEDGCVLKASFIQPSPDVYDGYYDVIANPLLWFLQHSLWDLARSPVIDLHTWQSWRSGYRTANQMFAEEIVRQVRSNQLPALVMLQDYHLYLVGEMIRTLLRTTRPADRPRRTRLMHFVHIPWPGSEYWGILPHEMRQAILSGLCAVDLVGFQTQEDGLNFIRTCESYLPGSHVNFKRGRVWYRNHTCHVRDFPISIDVRGLNEFAGSEEVDRYQGFVEHMVSGRQMILRIDRIDPSKNIVRGFQAFEEMLEVYPEHRGQVKFVALLVPSRLEVGEYQDYLDESMAAAGRVNARFGTSEWEPVRVLVGDNYARGIAALQEYDVLLVNSIADGMNLVAKEGVVVNRRNGVLVLSERAGVHQQLGPGSIVIAPCDVYHTAQALHQALAMPPEERQLRAERMRKIVEHEDINDWFCRQIETLQELVP